MKEKFVDTERSVAKFRRRHQQQQQSMKKIFLLTMAAAGLVSLTCAMADSVDKRLNQMVQTHIDKPWPDPESSNRGQRAWGLPTYALAALYANRDVDTANEYINALHENYNVPETTSDFLLYFKLNLLWRIYLDSDMNARLTSTAKANIRDMMWRWINRRSKVSDAKSSVWRVRNSENHDAMKKTGYLLCTQALKNAESPYGPDRKLADGHTIKEHSEAWQQYWDEYFRERAKEGINCEIASPTYAKYTVGCYYNIRDYAENQSLRHLAENFITLYWADTAVDFIPTGIRAGSQTRHYKHDYLYKGKRYSFFSLLGAYGWHDNVLAGNSHTYQLLPATSDYRVPEIITACAKDDNKPSYLYTSRRFGLGGEWNSNRVYTVEFEDNRKSYLRRDTYVTPAYAMGTLTLDPDKNYISLIDQNRAMGVYFSSDIDDRIVVHGKGESNDPRTNYSEINGVLRKNCMIVARDPNAKENTGTQIFVSDDTLSDNAFQRNGWFFTKTDDAYVAVKPANGGFSSEKIDPGQLLVLENMWAPIVVQTGEASDYDDFEAFRQEVMDNTFDFSDGKLTYTSKAGDKFEVWRKSRKIPAVNGETVDLNPPMTYDSPFLKMRHGEDTATFSYGDYPELKLDFSP